MAGNYSNDIGQQNSLEARVVMLTSKMDELVSKAAVTSDMQADPAMVQATQEANKFKLATPDTQGLGAYDRKFGYAMGNATLSWEEYTLRYERSRAFMLDNIDVMQTAGLAAASKMMGTFVKRRVVPEIDSLRIAAVAERAISGKSDYENAVYEQTITKADVISKLREGFDNIFQNFYVENGLIVYMDAAYRNILQGSEEFTTVRDVNGGNAINGTIDMVDGNQIKWIPSAYMKTKFDLNDGVTTGQEAGGVKPASDAKSINFLIRAPDTAFGIVGLNSTKFITKENNILADADFMALRLYHDAIVPKNCIPGVYVSIKESEARETETVEAVQTYTRTSKSKQTA